MRGSKKTAWLERPGGLSRLALLRIKKYAKGAHTNRSIPGAMRLYFAA